MTVQLPRFPGVAAALIVKVAPAPPPAVPVSWATILHPAGNELVPSVPVMVSPTENRPEARAPIVSVVPVVVQVVPLPPIDAVKLASVGSVKAAWIPAAAAEKLL